MTQRLCDANTNRAAEGLRVLEDIARFLLNNEELCARAKQIRHTVRSSVPASVLADRDTGGDVGTSVSTITEQQRPNLLALIQANAKRLQEALRVLEEYAKLQGKDQVARQLEAQRYASYTLERDLAACVPAHAFAQQKVYVLVDTSLTNDPLAVARSSVEAGAGLIQLRAKNLSLRDYHALAVQVQDVVRGAGGLFIVNDHVEIAVALQADGVHVGQDDMPASVVRQVVGPLMAIGVSIHTVEQLREAQKGPIDYVGLGPMYATTTKPHEPQRGPQLLDAVRDTVRVPSYAIGGLTESRIAELQPRLPHGVAIAGLACQADNVNESVSRVVHLFG